MNKSPATQPTTADTEIADRITNGLIVRGIDKKSLAEQIGLSYTTLRRRLEQHRNDSQSFNIRELIKIADVLEIKPSALLPPTLTKDAA